MLHSGTLFLIHPLYHSLHLLIPNFQSIPLPTLSLSATTRLLSTSARSLFVWQEIADSFGNFSNTISESSQRRKEEIAHLATQYLHRVQSAAYEAALNRPTGGTLRKESQFMGKLRSQILRQTLKLNWVQEMLVELQFHWQKTAFSFFTLAKSVYVLDMKYLISLQNPKFHWMRLESSFDWTIHSSFRSNLFSK